MDDAVLAETVMITSGDGTPIEAFSARSPGPGPAGGVIVLHSVLGYDDDTKGFARSLAAAGYNTVVPYLFHREAPGAEPNEALAAARARNTLPLPNDRVVADAAGAAAYLRGLFGAEDQTPSPAQVAELEHALKASGKTYEFRSYEGAGHGFFAADRRSYRAAAAADGQRRILTWLARYLEG